MSYEEDLASRAREAALVADQAAKDLRSAARELYFAGPSSAEIRYDERGRLDEVIAKNVAIHLEDMGGSWSLIVEGPDGLRVMVSLTTKKGVIVEHEGNVRETRP